MKKNRTFSFEKLYDYLPKSRVLIGSEAQQKVKPNSGSFDRNIDAIVYPKNSNEILKIVQFANKSLIPIYPISTGKNWGLGSKLPVTSGGIVMNLCQMNKIISINKEFGIVVIEPGVTQIQLFSYLKENNLPFMFNVTGSSAKTSIIGNCLDRGVGYFSSRVEDVLGIELITGSGKIFNTGFGHYQEAKANFLYPYGVGPDTSGLFFQSNFGIITNIAFRLIPEPQSKMSILCGLQDASKLMDYIQELSNLRKENVYDSVMHIANSKRSNIAILPHIEKYLKEEFFYNEMDAKKVALQLKNRFLNNRWTAVTGLFGDKKIIKHQYRLIKKRMKKYGRVVLLSDKKIRRINFLAKALRFIPFFKKLNALTYSIYKIFGLSQGVPSELAMDSVYYPLNQNHHDLSNPDTSNAGLLFSLPIIPLSGASLVEVSSASVQIFKHYGFDAFMTFNVLNDKSMESVINLAFDRQKNNALEKARKAINELNSFLKEKGYVLYRVDIDQMHQVLDKKELYWGYIKQLKQVFDPNEIIAPGRYSL